MTDRDRTVDYVQYRHRAHALPLKPESISGSNWSDATLLQISRLETRFEKLTGPTRLLYCHHKKTLRGTCGERASRVLCSATFDAECLYILLFLFSL